MNKIKIISVVLITMMAATSCSLVDKIKQKISSQKEGDKKEQTVGGDNKKEETVKTNSEADLNLYNKYIDVANKLSEVGDGMQKEYISGVPDPKTLKKNSMVLALSFDFKVGDMERILKDYKRSLFDGGELSKLTSDNPDMKKDIEADFKSLLDVMDSYYDAAKKTSDYYKNKDFENDLSLAASYDEQMKKNYDSYRSSFQKFNSTIRKYKPKRNQRDVNSISNPDEKGFAVLMNTYENTLDRAETFFEKFQKVDKNSDVSSLKNDISDFENGFNDDKKIVESTEFTELTKTYKYSFEDYFCKTVSDFSVETRKFLDNASKSKMKDNEFNRGYDNVVQYYNYMINAYNTNINTINMVSKFY